MTTRKYKLADDEVTISAEPLVLVRSDGTPLQSHSHRVTVRVPLADGRTLTITDPGDMELL